MVRSELGEIVEGGGVDEGDFVVNDGQIEQPSFDIFPDFSRFFAARF